MADIEERMAELEKSLDVCFLLVCSIFVFCEYEGKMRSHFDTCQVKKVNPCCALVIVKERKGVFLVPSDIHRHRSVLAVLADRWLGALVVSPAWAKFFIVCFRVHPPERLVSVGFSVPLYITIQHPFPATRKEQRRVSRGLCYDMSNQRGRKETALGVEMEYNMEWCVPSIGISTRIRAAAPRYK